MVWGDKKGRIGLVLYHGKEKDVLRGVLTLIQLGEVKVDLANFDAKFQAKFSYNELFFI